MVTTRKKVRFKFIIRNKDVYAEVKKLLNELSISYKTKFGIYEILNREMDYESFECEAFDEEFNKFIERAEKFNFRLDITCY